MPKADITSGAAEGKYVGGWATGNPKVRDDPCAIPEVRTDLRPDEGRVRLCRRYLTLETPAQISHPRNWLFTVAAK